MGKYKLCPGCGFHNNPLAIECEQCGEDLSSVRIMDEQTESQTNTLDIAQQDTKTVRMVRICEECGTKNDPNARKCSSCGEDISMIAPVPDEDTVKGFSLASVDGEFTFAVPAGEESVVIGREGEMKDYLQNKLFVSRRHASLSVSGGKLSIRSFPTSANGTHVNGIAVSPDQDIELNVGDIVGLGGNDPETQKDAAYFQVLES